MRNGQETPWPGVNPPHPKGAPPCAAAIEAWLLTYISELRRVKPSSIDVRRPFTHFGLSSAEGVILAGDLEKWLGGARLPATLAWDFPTIETLAHHLAAVAPAGNVTFEETAALENEEVEKILSEIEQLPEDHVPRSADIT
jgi:acyl carrier protein